MYEAAGCVFDFHLAYGGIGFHSQLHNFFFFINACSVIYAKGLAR